MPSLDAQARRSGTTRVLVGLAVAIAYVVAAQLGFRLAYVAEQITTVWAPTGIALAALLLYGIRLWPAIWLGALVASAGSEAPLWTALLIASGNTLEAVAGTWALQQECPRRVALDGGSRTRGLRGGWNAAHIVRHWHRCDRT
jgi:integral membrane sensor domain MASE1